MSQSLPRRDPSSAPLGDINARAQAWLRETALPLWAAAGVDGRHGGFMELLDLDGRPLPSDRRRLRVQARQIYVYADAAVRHGDDRARMVALRAFDWMQRHYWSADGGWVFAVDGDGTVVDAAREAYEQAFAIFASAWLLQAAPDCGAGAWIERTWAFLDERLASPNGGYRESLPDRTPRRQNPHMHLLEACLACHAATGDTAYLDRARALYGLFQRHWFDPRLGILGEYFDTAWQAVDEQRFEPGHHMEWCWLLQRLSERTGLPVPEAAVLHATAERHGRAADGLLIDECAADGAPILATKRCWPQTEEIKGQLAMYERSGDAGYLDRAGAAVERLFAHYLLPNGAWRDRVDADGRGIGDEAPASSLYHIALALNEFDRVLGFARARQAAIQAEP
ncbi:MAG: AGE family epimerase/isomerase [Alphaproteobacteria bacterium]